MGKASQSFELELPNDVIKQVEGILDGFDHIFGGMTRAGAEEVYNRIVTNVPESFKDSGIMHCLKITRTYNTPSDDGINTKVAFYGYFLNRNGEWTPAPLVCNMFEFGSSKAGYESYPKRPFLRRSFNKGAIEKVMLAKQKELSGGILDD